MKFVCLSDTHNMHHKIDVPDGDVLIFAGDYSFHGTVTETAAFNQWLGTLPHKHKIVIAGNHDWIFQRTPQMAREILTNATYLEDSEVNIEGFTIYGSPWQPEFFNWAFNLPRNSEALLNKWKAIPTNIDVLVTHGPPHRILDKTPSGERVGCELLKLELLRIRPMLHVFGHIHGGSGDYRIGKMQFVNASVCDEAYRPINPPRVIEL